MPRTQDDARFGSLGSVLDTESIPKAAESAGPIAWWWEEAGKAFCYSVGADLARVPANPGQRQQEGQRVSSGNLETWRGGERQAFDTTCWNPWGHRWTLAQETLYRNPGAQGTFQNRSGIHSC